MFAVRHRHTRFIEHWGLPATFFHKLGTQNQLLAQNQPAQNTVWVRSCGCCCWWRKSRPLAASGKHTSSDYRCPGTLGRGTGAAQPGSHANQQFSPTGRPDDRNEKRKSLGDGDPQWRTLLGWTAWPQGIIQLPLRQQSHRASSITRQSTPATNKHARASTIPRSRFSGCGRNRHPVLARSLGPLKTPHGTARLPRGSRTSFIRRMPAALGPRITTTTVSPVTSLSLPDVQLPAKRR